MPLGEGGQFGAMHGGLGPEFRGAQGQPVLVKNVEPSSAGGQHPVRTARSLGAQGLAEPAADPRQRRAASPGPGQRGQMAFGVVAAAEIQGDAPGQQVRLGRVARAKGLQPDRGPVRLAQHRDRYRADLVPGLDENAPRMGLPPGAPL